MQEATNRALDKVTAFIVRQRNAQRELLVFAHPTEGVQVPAGTVEEGNWSEIRHEEFDLNANPPELQFSVRGWVPSQCLSAQQSRRFFLLTVSQETPASWDQLAEGRYLFHLYWVPLVPRPQLMPPQDEWLDLVYEQLLDNLCS